jgi:hypothetical protein
MEPDPVAPVPVEPVTDTWNVRLVILFLGLTVLGCVLGGIVLAGLDKDVPESVLAVGSGAAGALAALLASTRGART